MVVIDGIRYRPEDAKRLLERTRVLSTKALDPERKARSPKNKAATPENK